MHSLSAPPSPHGLRPPSKRRSPGLLLGLLAATCLTAVSASAAGTRPAKVLTLEEATRQALEKNHDIAFEKQAFRISQEALRRADGPYDPSLRLDGRWRRRTDPVNSVLNGAPEGEGAPTLESLGLQAGIFQLLPTGGTIGVSAAAARETSNNVFTPITPSYPLFLGIDLRQPLLQNRSIDSARRAIRIARIDNDRSLAALRRTVTETVASVEKAYWSLSSANRDVAVQEGNVALAAEQLTETRVRIDEGLLPESDLAQAQAERERRRGGLLLARETAARAENLLKLLILGSDADPAWEETLIASDPPETPLMPVDLPSALKEALRIRPEMTDASLRLSRADVDAQAARDLVLPQVDFVASYARRGIAGGTNPDAVNPFAPGPVVVPPQYDGGFGRSFGTITENRFPDASVGVTVSLPVGNRAARAGRAIAAAAQEQARITKAQQTERVSVEVRNATITLQTAAGRIEAAIAGRIAAETQLRAEKERFAAGLSTNFFVLTRQNDLALARLTENAALTDYRKAITEFSRSAGTLLDDRKIRIEDKPAP